MENVQENWHRGARHSCGVKNIFQINLHYGTSELLFSINYLRQYILHEKYFFFTRQEYAATMPIFSYVLNILPNTL